MVSIFVESLLLIVATCLFIPILILFIECWTALLLPQTRPRGTSYSPNLKVLMPAHNEAAGIGPILATIVPQLPSPDHLIVVADNCSDNTAEIVRNYGATAIERTDLDRRGKGYALDYGLSFMQSDAPETVVLVDADCFVEPGTIEKIAQLSATTNRPVQAVYLMEQPAKPKPKDAVSALAFLVKNLVRPTGLARLGFPCLLTGTGMAFPWATLQKISLASGNIVEDMQLGIDLAIAGYSPILCSNAKVIGRLPQQDQAAKSQRERWEHGHLQTLLTQVPRLLKAALQQRRLHLLGIALDLSVPPLSLLVMLWLAFLMLAIAATLLKVSSGLPILLGAIQGGLILSAILGAWAKFGRTYLPAQTLLAVPFYVLWKIPLYLAFLVKRQTKWVRTDRDPVDTTDS